MIKQISKLKQLFETKQHFVITSHINPDADAIGSEVALARFLSDKGKSVTVLNQSETPDNLVFLTEIFPVHQYIAMQHETLILNADCFIVVDTNSPIRFNVMKGAVAHSNAFKICIDHHLEHEPFADEYIIDTDAPATGEILYHMMKAIDEKAISLPIAGALYAGIMTDTGSFRFPKTDSETHIIVADLLQRGVNQYEIFQQIYENGPLNKLQFLGKALNLIELYHEGKVAAMVLPYSIFAETKTKESDVDNLTQFVLGINGVVVGLVIIELERGVKISFRSKGDIPVNKLAKQFGGGGHKNAAGARITETTLQEILPIVLAKTKEFLK